MDVKSCKNATAQSSSPTTSGTDAPRTPWKGVKRGRGSYPCTSTEMTDRRAVAKQLLQIAVWLTDSCYPEHVLMTRICKFVVRSLRNHLSFWKVWSRWCAARDVRPDMPSSNLVTQFVHDGATQFLARPSYRWNQLLWWSKYLEAPFNLSTVDRLVAHGTAGGRAPGRQAVVADPGIIFELHQAASLCDPSDPCADPLITACALWLAVLRFGHWQRSILLKLTSTSLHGYCTLGKSRPGFLWLMPRYGIGGLDVGGRVWRAWRVACKARGCVVE